MMRTLLLALALFAVTEGASASEQFYRDRAMDRAGSTLNVVVDAVGPALDRLASWTRQRDGKVVSQSRNVTAGSQSGTILVDLKPQQVDDFLRLARSLGDVTSEASAQDFGETDAKGRVRVTFSNTKSTGHGHSRAFVFAGAVGAAVNQNGVEESDERFVGGGISVSTIGRGAQLSIISLMPSGADEEDDDGEDDETEKGDTRGSSLALVSHNVYSNLLGGGNNTFLNPYAGVSYGVARFGRASLYAVGANLGVDLVKIKWLVWSLAASSVGYYNAHNGGSGQIYSTTLAIPF